MGLSSAIPPDSRIVSKYRSIDIQVPGGAFWRISETDDRGCGGRRYRRIERIPRDNIPDIAYADPVGPVLTVVERGDDATVITRYWRPDDVEACALCPLCAARRSGTHPDLQVCIRIAAADVSEEDAAEYPSEWSDVLP